MRLWPAIPAVRCTSDAAVASLNARLPHLSLPRPAGMALATLFVTMPFVVRELLPILEQMDLAEEEAARWVAITKRGRCSATLQ